MKRIGHLALLALLPMVSGCLSYMAVNSENEHVVETRSFGHADRIVKAGITQDRQLCVFFENGEMNAKFEHFAVMCSIEKIRNEAQAPEKSVQTVRAEDIMTNRFASLEWITKKSDAPSRVAVTWAALPLPQGDDLESWESTAHNETGIELIPVGKSSHLERFWYPASLALQQPLLAGANQTVYLTRSKPIEFAYLDSSIDRTFTLVKVEQRIDKKLVRNSNAGNYLLLPLTVPIDLATLPISLWLYWEIAHTGDVASALAH